VNRVATYISVDSKDASRRTAVIRLLTYVNAAQNCRPKIISRAAEASRHVGAAD
jgi:hypothetical protein